MLAGVIVGAQTYPEVEDDPHWRSVMETLDKIILGIFTAEAALKMLSFDLKPWRYFAASLKIWRISSWNGWNCFDFAIVVASWSMDSNAATLLRLLRLLRVLKLVKAVNALQMILAGLYNGLKSIGYILILLLLVFYLFGILAMIMFRENDPFHFGSLPTTLLTLFRMATLEDWTDVMYINMFGCDVYGYATLVDSRNASSARATGHPNGTGEQLPCDLSKVDANLWWSAIFFVFFTIVSALVVMSLFIGVVTTTMMDASQELKREDKRNKTSERHQRKIRKKLTAAGVQGTLAKVNLGMGPSAGAATAAGGMGGVGGGGAAPGPGPAVGVDFEAKQRQQACCRCCDSPNKEGRGGGCYGKLAHWATKLVQSDEFQLFIIVIIVLAGSLVGIQTYPGAVKQTGGSCDAEDECEGGVLEICDWVILIIFTLEIGLKVLAEASRPWRFFYEAWNVFDFLIVFACYMPFAGRMVAVLRLLRLLRVLKLVKQLPQLQMIVNGLLQGLSSIGYISMLLFLVFYLYGVLAIILFRDNDPWHFSTLDIAMLTLFRCSTLEDWTDVMYINMYGCANYGYDLWDTMKEELCTDSKAHGILAAVYFVTFIIISALVMLSLFIGVVTTSMSEASDRMKEQEQIDQKVDKLKKTRDEGGRIVGPTDDEIRHWKSHFDAFDLDKSGTIDSDELYGVMDAMKDGGEEDSGGNPEQVQARVEEMIHKADTSGDGDVDFYEFCVLMHKVSLAEKSPAPEGQIAESPAGTPAPTAAPGP